MNQETVCLWYKGGAGWSMFYEGMARGWEEGLMYNSGGATANCQRYSSGLSGEAQRADEKQGWLRRRVEHDLGKSPAVTTHAHAVLYFICELYMGTCVHGATCSSIQWTPTHACVPVNGKIQRRRGAHVHVYYMCTCSYTLTWLHYNLGIRG